MEWLISVFLEEFVLTCKGNILKKYSVGSKGKLYPVVAYDTAKKQDIAEILVELD